MQYLELYSFTHSVNKCLFLPTTGQALEIQTDQNDTGYMSFWYFPSCVGSILFKEIPSFLFRALKYWIF